MKKLIIILFIFSIGQTSCKKFLETPVLNNVSVDDIFKDFQSARLTMVDMYNLLRGTNYYLRDMYLYADVAGGNVKYSRTSGQQLFQTYNFSNDPGNTDMEGAYLNAYKLIYNSNNVFKYVGNISDATQQQKNRIFADAFVFRALAHFDLVKTFALPYNYTANGSHRGIVLRLENTSITTPVGNPSSVNDVYTAILRDLDSAVLRYANSTNIYPGIAAKNTFSADFAKALKSRVLLYKEDYAGVVASCNELITANAYPLLSTSNYINSWRGRNNFSESVFELSFDNIIGTGIGNYFNPRVSGNIFLQYAATTDLLSLYATGDVRSRATFFVDTTISSTTYSYTRKYQGTSDSINNIKIFRASELYLNRAEAHAKMGNLSLALADLNVIRLRANPTAASFTSTSQTDIINEILNERRRELCFEGHLLFDIARNKRNLQRVDCSSPVCSFNYPDNRFASPIPVIF